MEYKCKKRELCKHCFEWLSARETDDKIARCGESRDYDVHQYLIGLSKTCPKFNEW